MTDAVHESLVQEIVDREQTMFLAVPSRGGTSPCQESPESFRIMREISHGALSRAYLESYVGDLEVAEQKGRNLMTEKYALMEGLIPAISTDPMIGKIVAAEGLWRRAVASEFPRTVKPDGHEPFCLYLGCELQTYSDRSRREYGLCVDRARQEGSNLARLRFDRLMEKLGYGSLAGCEEGLACADAGHKTGRYDG